MRSSWNLSSGAGRGHRREEDGHDAGKGQTTHATGEATAAGRVATSRRFASRREAIDEEPAEAKPVADAAIVPALRDIGRAVYSSARAGNAGEALDQTNDALRTCMKDDLGAIRAA